VGAVVAYHLWPDALPAGFLGVDVFMVVSGFIVTRLLLDEHTRHGRLRLAAFWGRRFRRLVPALMLVVVAVAVFVRTAGPLSIAPSVRSQGIGALLYVTNWRLIADGVSYGGAAAAGAPLVHLWSLAVEEQFYVVWPLVLAALLAISGRRRHRVVASVCVIGAVASAVEMAWLFQAGHATARLYYGTDTRAQAFLVGAGAAVIAPKLGAGLRRLLQRAALPALGALVIACFAATDALLYRGGFFVVAVAAAVVISATLDPGPVARLLDRAPLRAIGRVSYGIYLWHWPAIVLLTPTRLGIDGLPLAAVRLAVTALGTYMSWTLVERPIARARAPRVAWTGAIAMASATALLFALPVAPYNPYASYRTLDPATMTPVVVGATSIVTRPVGFLAPARSTTASWAVSRPTTVLLVGDSGLHSAAPALTAGLHQAGVRVVDLTYPGEGLTRPADAPQWFASWVRRYHVDLTIVMIGGWDVPYVDAHGPGAYRDVIEQSVRAFSAEHGRVLWLATVPGGFIYDRSNERYYAALPATHRGIVDYFDPSGALRAPGGTWPQIVNGKRYRQTDGWHFCPDGAAALSHAVLGHLQLDLAGWDAGPWRHDGRYDYVHACPAP
jgi:peptidoglycan/LPS O-acetylase OafA/YrhL